MQKTLRLPELPDIIDVAPFTANDQPLFDEIASVLRRYGAESRFGITLLHQHFQIGANEIIVEVPDAAVRTLVAKPEKRDDLQLGHTIETHWRFDVPKIANQVCEKVCSQGPSPHTKTC